ncbi:C2 domain-containing protein [Cavenderia fasciculata]|uniref:C2 domain-containing protein n=1 Tax=Cavenderia fasciculata TaxID=261658 RepID=F4Q703_CACFS|nr:C2 domain-containing protein [Cavenderia fasciculata]EGG16185.1 C2 domain-containing protein [Cavenderia fasciculata]|eukprot:XP_004354569.1 C2 domain-containing protein [Cavenderia fasciculata]
MNILQLNVLEARDLCASDSNGFSDPYVSLALGPQKKKTKVQKKTLNPKWAETFLMRISPMDTRLHIIVLDWDALSSDDFLGEVFLDLSTLDDQPTWHTLQPRASHPDDFVKGEICIKARIVTSSNAQRDRLPSNLLTEVNNRVSQYDENGDLLDLTGIGLETIPEFLSEHVPKLENLDLGFNQIKMFPSVKTFAFLQQLALSGNSIMNIPGDLLDLPQLKVLSLNGNQLISLPPEINKLVALEKLEIANNKIATLCKEVGELARLEELILSGNPLLTFPSSFSGLQNLEVLDANGCQLIKLPDEFTQLTRLLELNLGNNKLIELPEQIGRMTRLVVLNIMDNKLTDLPLSIGYCHALGKLGAGINIEGNPISSDEIKQKYKIGNDHLMDYLEKRMAIKGYELPDNRNIPKSVYKAAPSTNSLQQLIQQQQQQQQPTQLPGPSPSLPNQPPQQQQPQQPSTFQPKPSVGLSNPNNKAPPMPVPQDVLTKTIALKNWAIGTIRGDLRPKINKIKSQVLRCVNIQEGISVANLIKQIKLESEAIKSLIPSNYPMPDIPYSGSSGKIHSGNDKLEQLKDLISSSIDDIDNVLDICYQLIPNSTDPPLVIGVVQSLKKIKELLP